MFGICYGPVPLKDRLADPILDDDFMSEEAKPLWGTRGRDDLSTIRNLGANVVRLYGNNPLRQHAAFLDYAHSKGLGVIPGISDYLYTQMPGNCNSTGCNCYRLIKESYLNNLRRGFLTADRSYHPALRHVIVMNEPDMKLGIRADQAGVVFNPTLFARGIISAVDGMLDAEREANVTGKLINFTATISYTDCDSCEVATAGLLAEAGIARGQGFAFGQMLVLRKAFLDPASVGYYNASNNLSEFYRTRFLNSFNTQNDAITIRDNFVSKYAKLWQATPYFIEEYHDPFLGTTNGKDLDIMRNISLMYSSVLFYGFNFFEFQKRYDKVKLNEELFGMYNLGDYQITDVTLGHQSHPVWCLSGVPASSPSSASPVLPGLLSLPTVAPIGARSYGATVPEAVARVYGGAQPPSTIACSPNPNIVPLNQEGKDTICALGDKGAMATYITRIILHLGGVVVFQDPLREKASLYCTAQFQNFSGTPSLLSDLVWLKDNKWRSSNKWVEWYQAPACLADRMGSDVATVGRAIDDLCSVVKMNCSNVPAKCSGSAWDKADYIFSFYYADRSLTVRPFEPLTSCYFDGAAILKPPAVYDTHGGPLECVFNKDPAKMPVTAEGWVVTRGLNDPKSFVTFATRVIQDVLGSNVSDPDAIQQWSLYSWMVKDWDTLLLQLRAFEWVCGDGVGRNLDCTTGSPSSQAVTSKYAWLWIPFSGLAFIVLLTSIGSFLYVTVWTKDTTEAWFIKMRDQQRGVRQPSYEDEESDE